MCPAGYRFQELGKAGVLCPKAMFRGGEDIVGIKKRLKLAATSLSSTFEKLG